jgi:hypothetical protein
MTMSYLASLHNILRLLSLVLLPKLHKLFPRCVHLTQYRQEFSSGNLVWLQAGHHASTRFFLSQQDVNYALTRPGREWKFHVMVSGLEI